MPRIVKPGFKSPAAIKTEQRKRMKERERENAEVLAEAGLKRVNVRPQNSGAGLRAVQRGLVDTTNDPTLLTMVEYCLNKALMGFTWRQIEALSTDEFGSRISHLKAKRLVTAEMQKKKDPLVGAIRKKEDMRLDMLLTKLESGVNSGDVQAIHEARLISESRRRMYGADMPTNVRVTGEVEHKLDPAVQDMIAASKARIQAEQEAQIRRPVLDDPAIIDAILVEEPDPDFRDEPYREFTMEDDIEAEML